MRVRTTNNRLIGFAYKPGDAEQQELVAAGQSTEKAADHQHFNITPEGVELPERVGSYALNLYGAQMTAVGNEAREEETLRPIDQSDGLAALDAIRPPVDISGEEEPFKMCPTCDAQFTAKTPAAAKCKLTRHMNKEHN